jgi:hypothetical protein
MVSGKTVMNYREAGAAVKDAVADKLVIKRETPSLYVGRYVLDDAPMYWLYNSHDMDKSLTLTYEGAKGFDGDFWDRCNIVFIKNEEGK